MIMLYVRYLCVMAIVLWRHRGGRKCGPNCHCRDYL